MAKVKAIMPKITCSQRFNIKEENPQQVGWRIPREDLDWLEQNVDGNTNYVVSTVLRDFIKRAKIHLSQKQNLSIKSLDGPIDLLELDI